jgi:hypothetical protein
MRRMTEMRFGAQGQMSQQGEVELWISINRKVITRGFVIPNGVLCREESAGAGGVLAAGKKQIPPLRGRNDDTFYKLDDFS